MFLFTYVYSEAVESNLVKPENSHTVILSPVVNVLYHGALRYKQMNNRIGPTVKYVYNDAMHVLHNFFQFVMNTTAYHLSR